MARNLGIRVPAGFDNPDSVDNTVLGPQLPPNGNLGAIVAAILAAAADEMVCVVDLDARVVHARAAAGVDAKALIDAVTGTTLDGELKQLTDERSAVFIPAADSASNVDIDVSGAGALEVLVSAPQLVKRTLSSLIAALEDEYLKTGMGGASTPTDSGAFSGGSGDIGLIVVDQHSGRVSVFSVASANKATVRALFDEGGSLEDSVRYEQIPASEAAGAETLAFE